MQDGGSQDPFANHCGGAGTSSLKRSSEEISSSEEDDQEKFDDVPSSTKQPPPNGKKTKGRVKIKMEFIDNKLRRYTTFSKRKTGIMKKAYELSTLTGTQVMLLVASETGHVYTFATRKLQPMITSEAGKALIQTCLNSPDSQLGQSIDQRMSATGFEETELTYSIAEDEQKETMLMFDGGSSSGEGSPMEPSSRADTARTTLQQLPTATVLSSGGLTNGTQLQLSALSTSSQTQTTRTISQPNNNTLYRLQKGPIPIVPITTSTVKTEPSNNNQMTRVSNSQTGLSIVSGNVLVPSSSSSLSAGLPVMYQTSQGVVYATPGTTDGVVFNFAQSPNTSDQGHASTPQLLTIPVSLTQQLGARAVDIKAVLKK